MTTRTQPAPPPSPGLERAVAFLLAGILGLGSIVWAGGQLAGRLASGRWPHVTPTQAGGVLARLPRYPSDPARAWPPQAARLMPGAFWMYAVLTVLLAITAAVGVWVWRATKGTRAGKTDRAGGARWAVAADIPELLARAPQPRRLTIGRFGRHLVLAEERHSLLVVGPTQTGKTTGLAIPAILEWQGPVICTSVKTDLLRDTIDARGRRGGRVLVFDPVQATGIQANTWTPLTSCTTRHGAQEVAASLTSTASNPGGGRADLEHWQKMAAKLLAPLLYAAAIGRHSMADVVRWVDTLEEEEPVAILDRLSDKGALNALLANFRRDDRTRSGAYSTAENALEAYQDPRVQKTAEGSEITPELLLDGGDHTLYICAPAHQQERLSGLFVALIKQIMDAASERYQASGSLDPPLLVVLDEAANIAPMRGLDRLASAAADQGIQLVTIFQDLAQAKAVYGRDRAGTITTNHKARLFLGGSADPDTLEQASRLIGDTEDDHTTHSIGRDGHRSTTTGTRIRPLAPPDLLRRLPPDTAILIYGGRPAARIQLRPWYRDKDLQRLVNPTLDDAPAP